MINRYQFDIIMSAIEYKMVQNENLYNEAERSLGDAVVQSMIEHTFLKELVDFAAAALEDTDGIIEKLVFEKSGAMPYTIEIEDSSITVETWAELYDVLTSK